MNSLCLMLATGE